jgi:DNA polymerase III subunit chi
MTRVEFFTNVSNKHEKVISLCEKALAKSRQLTILLENERDMRELKRQLWQASPSSFLANAKTGDPTAALAPILLDIDCTLLHQDDVLINLQSETPLIFSRFRYVAEIVGVDEADKVQARARFKFYRDRGYQIKTTQHEAE